MMCRRTTRLVLNALGMAMVVSVAARALSEPVLEGWFQFGSDGFYDEITMKAGHSYTMNSDRSSGEVGTNDFRISEMGTDGDPTAAAEFSAVAFNRNADEYLVVWRSYVNGEFEIYGQRLDGAGQQIGTNDFRISDMGPDGDGSFAAHDPAIAFDPLRNEYLVVWSGKDTTGGGLEIYGQRLDSSGLEVGTNDFRISDMGPDDESFWHANLPDVAYDEVYDRFLVVWEGNEHPSVTTIYEIFGQCIDATTGAEFGTNDFVISVTGSGSYFDDLAPATACNPGWERCVVVWQATQVAGPGVQEFEIKGRAISTWDCGPLGPGFYVSDMGQTVSGHDAYSPDVVYNPDVDEYLIVWVGDDDSGDLANDEFEIFGQRIFGGAGDDPGPWDMGINDFRISDMGQDGDVSYSALPPAVAYDATVGRYLVVWDGDDDTGEIGDNEVEVFGQLLVGANAAQTGANDFRISDMGPDGDTEFAGRSPATIAGGANRFLVVWDGDDDSGILVENEFEIFGQLVNGIPVATCSYEIAVPNGGETWSKGSDNTILWSSGGNDCGTNVSLEAHKAASFYKSITMSTTNDGSYSWTIPTSYATDDDYRIRVTDMTNATYSDQSNSDFTITYGPGETLIFSDGYESGDCSNWSLEVP